MHFISNLSRKYKIHKSIFKVCYFCVQGDMIEKKYPINKLFRQNIPQL